MGVPTRREGGGSLVRISEVERLKELAHVVVAWKGCLVVYGMEVLVVCGGWMNG